jgi:hypothetical protein
VEEEQTRRHMSEGPSSFSGRASNSGQPIPSRYPRVSSPGRRRRMSSMGSPPFAFSRTTATPQSNRVSVTTRLGAYVRIKPAGSRAQWPCRDAHCPPRPHDSAQRSYISGWPHGYASFSAIATTLKNTTATRVRARIRLPATLRSIVAQWLTHGTRVRKFGRSPVLAIVSSKFESLPSRLAEWQHGSSLARISTVQYSGHAHARGT